MELVLLESLKPRAAGRFFYNLIYIFVIFQLGLDIQVVKTHDPCKGNVVHDKLVEVWKLAENHQVHYLSQQVDAKLLDAEQKSGHPHFWMESVWVSRQKQDPPVCTCSVLDCLNMEEICTKHPHEESEWVSLNKVLSLYF